MKRTTKSNPYETDPLLRRLVVPEKAEKWPAVVGVRAFDSHLIVLGVDFGKEGFAAHVVDNSPKNDGQRVIVEYTAWQKDKKSFQYKRNPAMSFLSSAAYGKNAYRVKQRLAAFRADPGEWSEEAKTRFGTKREEA